MFRQNVWLVICIIGVLSLITPAACFATATTHIWAPSTDVQAYGVVHITPGDVYIPVNKDKFGNRVNVITNEGLTVGVLPFEKFNIEVGFDNKTGYGELDNYPIYFNAKGGIPEGAFGEWFPALAVGAYDIGTKADKTNSNVLYFKGAKTFKINDFNLGRLSVGYFNGNGKLLRGPNGGKDNADVFGAWERTMSEISDKLWLCVEYQGTKSSYGCWNFGGSWKFSDNVSLLVGFDHYNNRNFADTVTVQVDIDFDAFSNLFKKK
ncbi:MAG: hypothetical protein PHX64_03940 [Candidatus Omnitrophica bacterium]|nr:hypothetical protein [Candidatus Omnitrophota bacterium]MDD5310885.1 hypothetical protein [Candidatus Omnitrophota bacterium]